MKAIILKTLEKYKKTSPPLLGSLIGLVVFPQCKFYPTCSEYTHEAIGKFGVFRGLGKGFLRIMRCNPFSKGGYNPLS